MPPVGFEPAIPTSERPKTHALDHAATGIGRCWYHCTKLHGVVSPNTYADVLLRISKIRLAQRGAMLQPCAARRKTVVWPEVRTCEMFVCYLYQRQLQTANNKCPFILPQWEHIRILHTCLSFRFPSTSVTGVLQYRKKKVPCVQALSFLVPADQDSGHGKVPAVAGFLHHKATRTRYKTDTALLPTHLIPDVSSSKMFRYLK
jgi:hypothetical protein